jgi:hypothetical protein
MVTASTTFLLETLSSLCVTTVGDTIIETVQSLASIDTAVAAAVAGAAVAAASRFAALAMLKKNG